MQKLISKLTLLAAIACVFALTGCGKHCLEDQCSADDEQDINPNAVVGPLLQTKWGQGSPYNDMFPYMPEHEKASDRNGRLVTDCGTTAATQIIAYHRHPNRATGLSTVLNPHGIDVPQVNFEDYTFDWANMRNTYTSADPGTELQRKAVAELMFIYGMARGISSLATARMVNYFGYDKSIQRLYRIYYNDAEWEAIIRQQLDLELPVHYYGTGSISHAFVIDGYDNAGRFHINWGWSGRDDGWYSLNALNPGNHDFNNDNSIIINIKPDAGGVGSNLMGLIEISPSKTSVSQNEKFNVTARIRSMGVFTGGQIGAVLVNNNGDESVICSASLGEIWGGSTWTRTISNCSVPNTVSPGFYKLQIVTRITGEEEWKIITLSDISNGTPNSIDFEVQ